MKAQIDLPLTAMEIKAVSDLLADPSAPLHSALRKMFDREARNADEQCRNECLTYARVNLTSGFAARARVFAEMFTTLKNRLGSL